MPAILLKLQASVFAAFLLIAPVSAEPAAEQAAPATPPAEATAAPAGSAEKSAEAAKPDVVLTKEELAEKEARKACKVDICAAFRKPAAKGSDIACEIPKSWRKEQLVKMVSKLKVTWPYGPVRCMSAINLKRDDLVKAVTAGKHTLQLDKHAVSCTIDKVDDKPASEIKFEFSPKVGFEKGKAVSTKMNWGKIEAPALIKGAMWTATAADNTINMLSGTLVEDINEFIDKKCEEVKEEWSARE